MACSEPRLIAIGLCFRAGHEAARASVLGAVNRRDVLRMLAAITAAPRATGADTADDWNAGAASVDITPGAVAVDGRVRAPLAPVAGRRAAAAREGACPSTWARAARACSSPPICSGVTARITDRVASAVRRRHGIEPRRPPVQREPHALRARGRRAVVGGVRSDRRAVGRHPRLHGAAGGQARRASSARLWRV